MLDAITSPRAVRWVQIAGVVLAVVIAIALVLPGVGRAAEPTPTATAPILPGPPVGTFTPSPPTWSDRGLALAVYSGGTVSDLEAAAMYAGASGVWVQDAGGNFQLLVARGPVFLNDQFAGAFPPQSPGGANFWRPIAVTLVK
ncbi:MAG: hypothetical protein AB7G21_07535 [Dehalococcoidia bacterium]